MRPGLRKLRSRSERTYCGMDIFCRFGGLHESESTFDLGDIIVQFERGITTVHRLKNSTVEYHDRTVARMERKIPQPLLQPVDLTYENFVIYAELFVRQALDVASLVLDPFHLEPKQRMQIVLPKGHG